MATEKKILDVKTFHLLFYFFYLQRTGSMSSSILFNLFALRKESIYVYKMVMTDPFLLF